MFGVKKNKFLLWGFPMHNMVVTREPKFIFLLTCPQCRTGYNLMCNLVELPTYMHNFIFTRIYMVASAKQVTLSSPLPQPYKAREKCLKLRWLEIVSSTYIVIGRYNHSLSLDATTMVSKNCPTIGEHVVTIFVTL